MSGRNNVRAAAAALAILGMFSGIGGFRAQAAAAQSSSTCREVLKNANVIGAHKLPGPSAPAQPSKPIEAHKLPGSPAPPQSSKQAESIELKDRIAVTIEGFNSYQQHCGEQTVLFLNGHPIRSLSPYASSGEQDRTTGKFHFFLSVTEESRSSWIPILGRPCCSARPVEVSIGVEDQIPLRAANGGLPKFRLNILGNIWFAIWAVLFAAMVGVFFWCVHKTNIIRDKPIVRDKPNIKHPKIDKFGVHGAYSLSKSQGALWFFVILASYLLIGLVTGNFTDSINSTALILLGIGAGTVIGAAVIGGAKETQDADKTEIAIASEKAKLEKLDGERMEIEKKLKTNPPEADEKQLLEKKGEIDRSASAYLKLLGENEHFLTDILSDANGVSFHRFQMAAWTFVLGLIFVKGVYDDLAMPEFNTTLMGLLGLSAGTYLGLKIPEATTPKN
jgi:hypothetical protein